MIQLEPLEFFPDGNPRQPLLQEAIDKYCEQEFGQRVAFSQDIKTWAAVSQEENGWKVHGLVSIRLMLDCHTFHVTAPSEEGDRQKVEGEREIARTVRDLLLLRASSFIQDHYGRKSRVMVYVSAEKERYWKSFLRMIKAKPANRYELEV